MQAAPIINARRAVVRITNASMNPFYLLFIVTLFQHISCSLSQISCSHEYIFHAVIALWSRVVLVRGDEESRWERECNPGPVVNTQCLQSAAHQHQATGKPHVSHLRSGVLFSSLQFRNVLSHHLYDRHEDREGKRMTEWGSRKSSGEMSRGEVMGAVSVSLD